MRWGHLGDGDRKRGWYVGLCCSGWAVTNANKKHVGLNHMRTSTVACHYVLRRKQQHALLQISSPRHNEKGMINQDSARRRPTVQSRERSRLRIRQPRFRSHDLTERSVHNPTWRSISWPAVTYLTKAAPWGERSRFSFFLCTFDSSSIFDWDVASTEDWVIVHTTGLQV